MKKNEQKERPTLEEVQNGIREVIELTKRMNDKKEEDRRVKITRFWASK